jgi:hypothetical protein
MLYVGPRFELRYSHLFTLKKDNTLNKY